MTTHTHTHLKIINQSDATCLGQDGFFRKVHLHVEEDHCAEDQQNPDIQLQQVGHAGPREDV